MLVFRGIPFARPPVGALRFEPPQDVEPWPDVRDATRFGPAAPQTQDLIGPSVGFDQPASAEDCLTLNVWTPEAVAGRRPVQPTGDGSAPLQASRFAGQLQRFSERPRRLVLLAA
jgi:para-nitrobenzyl esterase